jgi:hypothetical protein
MSSPNKNGPLERMYPFPADGEEYLTIKGVEQFIKKKGRD